MKNLKPLLFAILIMALHSCSINTETTYYKDSSTSMQSDLNFDNSIMELMKGSLEADSLMFNSPDQFKNLSQNWKSLFDIQKEKNSTITLNEDSAKVLKKIYMKINKSKNQLTGFSFKYDKLYPDEVNKFLEGKDYKKTALKSYGKWDGTTLIIDTQSFNPDPIDNDSISTKKPISKSDSIGLAGEELASKLKSFVGLFNVNINSTLKFQKPIVSVVGKHDFVKQVDNKTIQINIRSKDLLDGGKNLTNKDKQIIVTTK